MYKLAPSIFAADLGRLGEEAAGIERAGAHLIHIDVMDGHFVPNLSFGSDVMKSLIGRTALPFDVHLMIEDPDRYIKDFVTEKTEYITVHQEACKHLHRTIGLIKSYGIKAGVAINPGTPAGTLVSVLGDLDMVLVMSVNPGFYGQKFIKSSLEKIRYVNEVRNKGGLSFEIEVDGGVTKENIGGLVEAGAGIIVAGNSVFSGGKIYENVQALLGTA